MFSRTPFLSKFQVSVAHKRHVQNLECRKEAAAIFYAWRVSSGHDVLSMPMRVITFFFFFGHRQHLGFTPSCALPDSPSVFSISGPDECPAPHKVITFPTGYFIIETEGLKCHERATWVPVCPCVSSGPFSQVSMLSFFAQFTSMFCLSLSALKGSVSAAYAEIMAPHKLRNQLTSFHKVKALCKPLLSISPSGLFL